MRRFSLYFITGEGKEDGRRWLALVSCLTGGMLQVFSALLYHSLCAFVVWVEISWRMFMWCVVTDR
jgi:hypothetical protein